MGNGAASMIIALCAVLILHTAIWSVRMYRRHAKVMHELGAKPAKLNLASACVSVILSAWNTNTSLSYGATWWNVPVLVLGVVLALWMLNREFEVIGNKHWLVRHVNSYRWVPARLPTVFGYPLCTMLFDARGPYRSENEAAAHAAELHSIENRLDQRR